MSYTAADYPLVAAYLDRVRSRLEHAPPGLVGELVDDLDRHIEQRLAQIESPSEASIQMILDELGGPEEIAAAAWSPPPGSPPFRDACTVILLELGAMVLPVVGWLIGVSLLWTSRSWTGRQKLLGTLVVPGGLVGAYLLYSFLPSADRYCATFVPSAASAGSQTVCVSHGLSTPAGIRTALALTAAIATVAIGVWLWHSRPKMPSPRASG